MARLWDLMLCLSVTRRLNRASSRKTNWKPPYSRPTDNLIYGLLENTRKVIPAHIFPRLWAPMVDPSTGVLDTNLAEKINEITKAYGIRVPFTAEELWMILMTPERWRFLDRQAHRRISKDRQIGSLPGLTIEFVKDPVVEILDPQGRIHCPFGPAVVYGDGTPEFYWRGTRVPSTFIPITDQWREKYPHVELIPLVRAYKPLTAMEALSIENIETRRAACEIVGWHNILEDLNAAVVNRDKDPTVGELLRVFIPANGDMIAQQFLRVRCGTGRIFALMVPNECRTALEANAWTYDLRPEDYRPEIRT
jgi:hypothetical protein